MRGELAPEELLSLRILLDRVHHSGERCRSALLMVNEGKMTREDYAELLREQMAAQRDWEDRHLKYELVRET